MRKSSTGKKNNAWKKSNVGKRNSVGAFMTGMALAAAVLMAGCGSSSASYEAAADTAASQAAYMDGGIYESKAAYSAANAAGALPAEVAEEEGFAGEGGSSVGEVKEQATDRKLIKNVNMDVETEEFDKLIANVESKVEQLGGYIESSSIYNGSYTSDYRSRSADITARIPSGQLELFVTDVAEQSNVIRKNESVEDVTLQYVDLESHKNALLAEQESLLSMLEAAETVEDIIKINEQLTNVRYQLESMESQLRTYDNRIDYSTVYLYVNEVAQYEPYAPKSTSERISSGFTENLRKVGNGFQEFGINFVIYLPYILAVAAVAAIALVILFAIIRAGEKRRGRQQGKQKAGKKEKENGQQTMPGRVRDAGGTSQCGQIHADESPDRPENSDHLQ